MRLIEGYSRRPAAPLPSTPIDKCVPRTLLTLHLFLPFAAKLDKDVSKGCQIWLTLVPNPGLKISWSKPNPKPKLDCKQNQIQNWDSDLIQNKTKSKTETQIWL